MSISVPLKFSHKPPVARSWLIIMNLAPPVPRKVTVSLKGLFSSIVNINIEYGRLFYNWWCFDA
jgi:hypothetical protein